MSLDLNDKKKGCLYGLAIGDALGAAVEFKYPGEFAPVTCYRSGGPHSLAAGQWTDDTSMALALADSIKEKGWDLDDQIKRYLDWFQNGTYSVTGWCFDIGTTTRSALCEYELNGDVLRCADSSPGASGNGSIMRLAPVVIKYLKNNDLCDKLESSSITTHSSDQCKSSCVYMGLLLAALMEGVPREDVLSSSWVDEFGLKLHPLVDVIARGSYKLKSENTIVGGGWVIQSLEAALWAFYQAPDFETAVLKAVNLGNDADTTGAVCGQLAGAYWGYSGIPQSLIDGLDRKDMIEAALQGL